MTSLISSIGAVDKSSGDVKLDLFTYDTLWATIGASADQKRFEQRTLALVDPAKYEKNRNDALEKLKKAVGETFTATYNAYIAAGYAPSESKQLAIAASRSTYNTGVQAIRASFPSAVDSIYQQARTDPRVMMARAASSRPRRAKPARAAKAKPARATRKR